MYSPKTETPEFDKMFNRFAKKLNPGAMRSLMNYKCPRCKNHLIQSGSGIAITHLACSKCSFRIPVWIFLKFRKSWVRKHGYEIAKGIG